MMFQYLLPQKLPVYMRINLGSGNLLMPQHILDGPEISSPFQQMCGKGMAEGMRAHILMYPRHLCLLLDNMEYHNT